MFTCKYSIKRGSGRYTRRCEATATEAIVFMSWLDHGHIIQTQMPLCSAHLYEKANQLTEAGITNYTVSLGSNGLIADGKL